MYSKSSSSLSLSYQPKVPGKNAQYGANSQQQEPDLSYLSESERKIIEAVLERQRADEKSSTLPATRPKTLHNSTGRIGSGSGSGLGEQLNHSITDIAEECKQRYGSIDTGSVCNICKKTKFTNNGSGHVCFNCKLRCCVKCAYKYTTKTKVSSS
jgi:hypothetical protein